ncbi:hypothetical protein [Actinotalea sp. Marseille-Q4924]|uniref:hypothetical protein n=1 Tax=Actinotalea sp. Marseille-Q4924 TaxID=2866571 RepID=UPI001CE48686|nr:hypothetical protein [Actinotalea sp. Marseille-Q4924]
MSQLVPWLVLCLLVLAAALIRPQGTRYVVGVFFIVMGVGVNWVLSVAAPEQFVGLGVNDPLLPAYAWFFENVVAAAPAAVGILAGAGEIAVGVLMLGRRGAARLGLLAGAAFLLVITPLGLWTLPNVVLAGALAVLSRHTYDHSMVDALRRHVRAPAHGVHPAS